MSEREYDLKEAAQKLGVSEHTLRRMVANRQIGHYRVGAGRGRFRFLESHIQSYRTSRMVEAITPAAA